MHKPTDRAGTHWPAPAKLNLFLHITGRQSDGYHDLQTLFQILDWGDELRFSITDDGRISRHCNIDSIPEDSDICVKAARRLQQVAGVSRGVHIDLTKHIPTGAGLGGGSSDAATTLVALNELWGCRLTSAQLAQLGLELGADVPVFVHGRSALAQGRGEDLMPVVLGQRYYLLVFPGSGVSTAEVFRHPDLVRDTPKAPLQDLPLNAGRNDCLEVVTALHPFLLTVMDDMRKWGKPRMSGTGSTFFLQFASENAAIDAANHLKCLYNVRAVSGVDSSPLLERLSESERLRQVED
jgi:4-diphosphocytidyl-2-C-methyl-D-erythritol kinase